jgi:hypothetical protein
MDGFLSFDVSLSVGVVIGVIVIALGAILRNIPTFPTPASGKELNSYSLVSKGDLSRAMLVNLKKTLGNRISFTTHIMTDTANTLHIQHHCDITQHDDWQCIMNQIRDDTANFNLFQLCVIITKLKMPKFLILIIASYLNIFRGKQYQNYSKLIVGLLESKEFEKVIIGDEIIFHNRCCEKILVIENIKAKKSDVSTAINIE